MFIISNTYEVFDRSLHNKALKEYIQCILRNLICKKINTYSVSQQNGYSNCDSVTINEIV